MKFLVLALFVVIGVSVASVAADDAKYTSKYDGIDIDEILTSDRLFNNYYKCLMDKGKCTPDGRELKRVLPDALKTECAKCTETQRGGTEKVLRFLIENKKTEWKELSAKYDPEGVYQKKYEKEAASRGITVPV